MNTFKLENGLVVIHREIPRHPVVSVSVFARSGVIIEPQGKRGMTYLTQSLITKGTKTKSAGAIAADSEKIGAGISASSDKDYALVEMDAARQHAEAAAAILADVVINPVFPKAEFDKEKTAAIAAALSRKDRIFTVADDLSNEIFYGDAHPYSSPETGAQSSLSKISREDVVKWHASTYKADNVVISVAGDITLDEARRIITSNFLAMPSGGLLKVPKTIKLSPRKKNSAEAKHAFRQAFLMLSYPAPRVGEPGYAELKLIAGALGSRMSGRLFRELREKRSLAYEVNALYPTRFAESRFAFYIGLDAANIVLARKELGRIIAEVKETGLSDEELAETKRYLSGIWKLQRQTAAKRSFYDGFWTIMGKSPAYDEEYLSRIKSLDNKAVLEAARKFFDDAAAVEIKIMPK